MGNATNIIEELKAKHDVSEEDMLTVEADTIDDINTVLAHNDECLVSHFTDDSETETTVGFREAIKEGREAVAKGLDVAVDILDGTAYLHVSDYR